MQYTLSLEATEKYSRVFIGVQCFDCKLIEYPAIETVLGQTDYELRLRRLGNCTTQGHNITKYLNGLEAW